MRTLYAWLPILVGVLPPVGVVWYVVRRGRSVRVAAWFVVPYWTILTTLGFWVFGFRGLELLGAVVLVAGVASLVFYSNAMMIDALVRRYKK
jgi:hypothetical protein